MNPSDKGKIKGSCLVASLLPSPFHINIALGRTAIKNFLFRNKVQNNNYRQYEENSFS